MREGKILSWGVSNFDVTDLAEALAIAGAGPDRLQPGALPPEGARDRARRAALVRGARRRAGRLQPVRRTATSRGPRSAGGRVLAEIAAAHGATPRQVALGFLVRRPALFTIPKASRPEHAAENAAAGSLELSAAELARIDAAFPLGRRPRELPTL